MGKSVTPLEPVKEAAMIRTVFGLQFVGCILSTLAAPD